MPRSVPPLTWFRAYESAARHLSFTAAAEELHLTQSAISQQVRSLEVRLGEPLFHRRPRGLALTDEGRKLLPEVSAALGTLAAVANRYDVRDARAELTVAASVSFIQWVITPAIHRLRVAAPDLRLRLVSTVWPDDFRVADADVEIRFGTERLVADGAKRLLPDDLVVVAATSLRVDPDHLDAHPLIETVGTTDGWKQWAKIAGYPEPVNASLFVDYHGAALDLAVAGAGVALTSSLLATRSLVSGNLQQVRPEALSSRDGYFLVARERAGKAVRSFADWLESELAAGREG